MRKSRFAGRVSPSMAVAFIALLLATGGASYAAVKLPARSVGARELKPKAVTRAAIKANGELADAFDRCREYLRENGVDLVATPATLGPWVTFDAKQEQFVGEFAKQANALSKRDYRKPFVVPKLV